MLTSPLAANGLGPLSPRRIELLHKTRKSVRASLAVPSFFLFFFFFFWHLFLEATGNRAVGWRASPCHMPVSACITSRAYS